MLSYFAPSYTCFALFQLASISSRVCRDLDHLSGAVRELRPLSPADVGLQIIWRGDKRIYSWVYCGILEVNKNPHTRWGGSIHHVINKSPVLFLPCRRRIGRCVRGSLT